MKKIRTVLIACALFLCSSLTLSADTAQAVPQTFKDSAKAQVAEYVALIKPMVEAITESNKIGGIPENIVYGILSLIAVSIIMAFHRKALKKQAEDHAATLKAQNDTHASVIKDIVNDKA